MRFTKMQGAGNDFIIIDNRTLSFTGRELAEMAKQLCRRRFSIGADGLMAVETPEKGGDFRMLFFNADGSLAEMCGNGARCIAKYAYDKGIAGTPMAIETTSGMVRASRLAEELYSVQLNDVTGMKLHCRLEVSGRVYDCDYVEMGEPPLPHLTVEYKGLAHEGPETLRKLGRALCHHRTMPKGANVNFYEISEEGEILEKTFERGVEDFTLACGTGTAAVAAALTERGLYPPGMPIRISMAGGQLSVKVEKHPSAIHLYLTGPAVTVYEGTADVSAPHAQTPACL